MKKLTLTLAFLFMSCAISMAHGPGFGRYQGNFGSSLNQGQAASPQTSYQGLQDHQGFGLQQINSFPQEPISDQELYYLNKMVQEEKLARDVYAYFGEKYNQPSFNLIAEAEERHMEAVSAIFERYGLENPVTDLAPGEFKDPNMKALFEDLIERGSIDLGQAYLVSATIEDMDINDLKECLSGVDNQDIRFVFQNLQKGSRNHMRAFSTMMDTMGMTYTPQFMNSEEFQFIINSQWERGPVDQDGHPMEPGYGFQHWQDGQGWQNGGFGSGFGPGQGPGQCPMRF